MPLKPLWLSLLFGLFLTTAYGQEAFNLTAESLTNGQAVELDQLGWKYTPGDDPRFAEPQFDDSAWEILIGTAITLNSIPKSGWHGIGWFRLRLQVDPALANQSLALVMVHFGASEIYLDGKLVQRFGTVGATPETEVKYNPNTLPFDIVLDGRREHVIAVRHSCMVMRDLTGGWGRWFARLSKNSGFSKDAHRTSDYGAGIGIRIVEFRQSLAEHSALKSRFLFVLIVAIIFLAIGVLHLLLYWFYPRQRANLLVGVFSFFGFVNFVISYLVTTGHYWGAGIVLPVIVQFVLPPVAFFLILTFPYTAFSLRLPKRCWILGFVGTLVIILFLLHPSQLIGLLRGLVFLAIFFEIIRVVIQAVRKKIDGAWIIGVGLVLFVACLSVGILPFVIGIPLGSFSVLLPTIAALSVNFSLSIFLARQFARTSLNLEEQLVQVKQLSAAALEHEKVKAENDRRAAELEEARQLQLSMLPKKLPSLPHLDIAAYMKTASEVGGDYYDFHVGEDGTLTIAVGDATGHGLKAGTMVSVVKGLFVSLAYHPDIPHIFHRISAVLKEMKLRGLFMAMTMVKVKGHQMSVSIAGMPSVLIFRALSGEVEEVVMRALPLGGMSKYEYKQQELTLAANDVVVLMSDGLPERFNSRDEMLEEEAAKQYLAQHAQASAQEIINGLAKLGDDWGGARPQDDDVTFVVLKYVECGRLDAAFRS